MINSREIGLAKGSSRYGTELKNRTEEEEAISWIQARKQEFKTASEAVEAAVKDPGFLRSDAEKAAKYVFEVKNAGPVVYKGYGLQKDDAPPGEYAGRHPVYYVLEDEGEYGADQATEDYFETIQEAKSWVDSHPHPKRK